MHDRSRVNEIEGKKKKIYLFKKMQTKDQET